MAQKIDKELSRALYKLLFLIRRCEEKIIDFYHENEMKTPMHMSMGEEAIAVGVCHALAQEDLVLGTYRSHALYLAKTQDIGNFFAEMYGKDTALLKGKGGSMHLCDPGRGFMGTSAIVASSIPVAVGVAFANKMKKNGRMVAVFFGDGATDEGVFWESLNLACLMKLPMLFVCEDNGLAVHTHGHQRRGYDSLSQIVSKFRCRVFAESTTDAEVIYRRALKAAQTAREEQMPCLMHLEYFRYLENVGINEDFDAGYRSREEFEAWRKNDPVSSQRRRLAESGVSEEEIREGERALDAEICDTLAQVKQAPFCGPDELCKGVYHEEDILF